MLKYFPPFLFILFFAKAYTQSNSSVDIVYKNCTILSESQIEETIAGVKVLTKTQKIKASQYVQTRCNFGNPSDNRFDSVTVLATVSCIKDSNGILKTAIYNEFLRKIDQEEKYCASNNYAASVVPEYYFYTIDTICFPGIRKLNSSEGNDVIWYIDGSVYKITLIEDNKMGNLNVLLRENVRIKWNGKLLDADAKIADIVKIKPLLQTW